MLEIKDIDLLYLRRDMLDVKDIDLLYLRRGMPNIKVIPAYCAHSEYVPGSSTNFAEIHHIGQRRTRTTTK